MSSINKNFYSLQKINKSTTSIREQRIGTLIIWFAALILLEGVFRKWLLTPIEQPLVFIREPVLFLIYYYYSRDFGIRKSWFIPYLIFSGLIVVIALVQAIYWEYSILVPLLGIRFYLFYIPLAFIMGEVLTQYQMARLLRFLLWTSIPIGILVFLQFMSPVESPINKGTSDDVEGRFTVVGGIVRPYGPFTFVAPQANWAAMLLAVLIICWERLKIYSIPIWLFLAAMAAILVMGALSGARTYFGLAILVMVFYILAGLTSPNIAIGVKRFFYMFSLAFIFLIVFIVAIPKAYESMSQRQENAMASEGSTVGRAVRSLTEVTEPFNHAPMFGYGLGAGSNAGNAVRNTSGLSMGESEWGRMINELGTLFGYPVVLLRTLFVLWLGYMALVVNRRTGDGSTLIIFGFLWSLLLLGQITMQNQLVAICWFAVGLQLAFIRLAKES